MIPRHAISHLNSWKSKTERKPLVIRGARQVGKTTLVKSFAETYDQFLYFNLDLEEDRLIFDSAKNIKDLIQVLFLSRQKIVTESSLIFIDEIQESGKAIRFLRYFHEEYPQLHVIAAGSLLEHALRDLRSFPVGRVEYLTIYPLNFREFLLGTNKKESADILNEVPIPDFAHEVLKKSFHEYAMIGGMPEVVRNYNEHGDLTRLQSTYQSILQGYMDDVPRYASTRNEAQVIQHVLQNAPQLAESRITFQNFAGSSYRAREVGEAFRSLQKTRLLYLLYPSTQVIPPPIPNKRKKPRLQFLDTGLMVKALNIYPKMVTTDDLNQLTRGRIAQHIVGQEIQSIHYEPSYLNMFWTRETSSDAEVDFLIEYQNMLVPVEVKSGKAGRLRSLYEFIDRCHHDIAVRLYAGNYLQQRVRTLKGKEFTLINLPYYLAGKIEAYIQKATS